MHETRTKIGTWLGFLLILIWCLLPIAWIISLSFKGPDETAAGSPQARPGPAAVAQPVSPENSGRNEVRQDREGN